jgi:hypothetical protein
VDRPFVIGLAPVGESGRKCRGLHVKLSVGGSGSAGSLIPTKNRLPVRVVFDVQGIGPWTHELSIYVPTAEQMAKRAKAMAEMPWLGV